MTDPVCIYNPDTVQMILTDISTLCGNSKWLQSYKHSLLDYLTHTTILHPKIAKKVKEKLVQIYLSFLTNAIL